MQKVKQIKPFEIQRSCVYDGPGIRTTIFFQGCSLRCVWCQNPEMQSFQGDITPECNYSIDDIIEIVSRDKDYYSSTKGGVTLSGGEPFLQDPDSLIRLLELLKKENIKITIETCLHAPWKNIENAVPYIDLFLIDLKVVGDDDLHIELTKQDSKLIHSNIKKLFELGANIKFRMVMVPGYTDHEENIKATSEFLKSIKYDSIELMKFHNLYEEKAERFGLEIESLNITPEQSLESIKKAAKLFEKYNIKAENAELNTTLQKATFTPRVKYIQKIIRESGRGICTESARLKTEYYKKFGGFKKPTPIHRAESLSHVLHNKRVIVYPKELLVGNFTSKRVAGQFWVEYMGIIGIKTAFKFGKLKPVSFEISLDDAGPFFKMFNFWVKKGLLGRVHENFHGIFQNFARVAEMNMGFNNNMAAICHFIPNYDRILELGTSGLIEQIKETQKKHPEHNRAFYKGAIIALEALEVFAQRYADYLSDLSKNVKDPERRKELEKMAEICAHVPKNPARTFHEALQSMLLLHITLCIEQFENAISFGRLDQILYPYYKQDLEAGRITYEEAKELICLFILKMDEDIYANDGETFLELFRLFETLSTDQAVTFGGVDKDGNDATNDVTYMLLDACELQPMAADMAARVHKGSPDKYLERIAEIYLNGTPVPQIFSDEIYIPSIMKHYDTTLEHARNYSIVGCVEPNASDDHFGNTDCANVNLAMPLLQAIKGHENNLWNYGFRDQILKIALSFFRYSFKGNGKISRLVHRICDKLEIRRNRKLGLYNYKPPSSMEELLERFQKRLNFLTNSILKDHQKIEEKLRMWFTTPLASSLFKSCLESGKDAYEGGTTFNSSGIQAVGVTDVADSLHALNEVVFKKKLYTIRDIINAIEFDFQGVKYQEIRETLLAVPKFGDDSSKEPTEWMNKVMEMYNNALDSVPNCPRDGRYSAGYYALNVCSIYGKNTPALPSGRHKGVSLANGIIPHYEFEPTDLLSSLNSIAGINFVDHAENGATATLTIDSALFQGPDGVKKLANIFKTFLITGGMQLQPNVINKKILLEAYKNPEKHRYLMVRIAGYCAYFYELSEEMKQVVINRTCYS